jgi:pimeloyl-ACP methyl ester carboxylesterase
MNRKTKKRIIKISILVLIGSWMVTCQFIMQFRVTDDHLERGFEEHGIDFFIGTTRIDGHDLHYAKTGIDTASTLLFIHGTPGSLNDYHPYLTDSELVAHYRLISIDRPGFGYSDFGNTIDIEHQASLISALIDSFSNQKRIYLMGHSLAGPLVIKLAALKPSVISGIIILAGSVDPSLEPAGWWRPIVIYSPLRWMIPTSWRYSNEEQYWLKDDLVKLKNDFPNVSCPVYIFHGDKDENVPVANVGYAKNMLVNSKNVSIKIFEGGDHFLVWNKYDEIKRQLLKLEN